MCGCIALASFNISWVEMATDDVVHGHDGYSDVQNR